jgi:hypothetical protein
VVLRFRRRLSGNEALARGAWEAGVRVGAGYPGTPSTEILEALARLPGVDCEWSPNEKVALEVAVGASLGGARAMATMKHVGVNVAADPLFSVAYMGVNGGLVVVSADDPGMHSSQNEQDNRLFARHARIPLLEPPRRRRRGGTSRRRSSSRRISTRRSCSGPRRGFPMARRGWTVGARARSPCGRTGSHGRRTWCCRRTVGSCTRIEEQRIPGLAAEAERWVEVLGAWAG